MPSIEEVAMWIEFEAVRGTGGGFGLLPAGDAVFASEIDGAGDDCCAETRRLAAPTLGVGSGGGKGDIETAETEVE